MLISRCVQHIGLRQCLVAGDIGNGEVAASFGPFVVLLGQHRAHQAPRRPPVGEDAHTSVRRRISRFSRSCGLLDHSFCQWDTGKAVKARMSGAASASRSAPGERALGVVPPPDPVGRGPRRETVAGRWCAPWWPRRVGRAWVTRVSRLAMKWGAAALPAGPRQTPRRWRSSAPGEHRRSPVPPR